MPTIDGYKDPTNLSGRLLSLSSSSTLATSGTSAPPPMPTDPFVYMPPSDTNWFNGPSFEKPDWNLEEPYFLVPRPYIDATKTTCQEEQAHAKLHCVDCNREECKAHDCCSNKHPAKKRRVNTSTKSHRELHWTFCDDHTCRYHHYY
jgi:hypothetical protein